MFFRFREGGISYPRAVSKDHQKNIPKKSDRLFRYKDHHGVQQQQATAGNQIYKPFVASVRDFGDGVDIDDIQVTRSVDRVTSDNGKAFRWRDLKVDGFILQFRHLVHDDLSRDIFSAEDHLVDVVDVDDFPQLSEISEKAFRRGPVVMVVHQSDEPGTEDGFLQKF